MQPREKKKKVNTGNTGKSMGFEAGSLPVCVCVCVHAHAFVHMFCYNVEKDLAFKLLGRWDKGGGGEESIPKSIRTQ